MNNSALKVFTGILVGAIGGYMAGILMAPDSGQKTRKKWKKEASKFTDEVTEKAKGQIESAKTSVNKKIDDFAETGKKSLNSLKETMK